MKTKKQNIKFLFVALFTLGLGFQAQAKKTVCSITINSDDEIKAFKAGLSSDEFNFVELGKKGKEQWFREACESKVKCDVLLISGHFGGMFFGDSGMTLSMKELEEASCQPGCDGVLKAPQEVYLFGCNTLAGKQTDRRTPEQYYQVLLNDGYSASAAQQVVAFRYSPIGATFANRMTHVFNKTPRIYGFNSVSPLGRFNAPIVKSYIQTIATSFANSLDNPTTSNNALLLKLFSGTSIVQSSGKSFSSPEMSPVCFLSGENKKVSRLEKLRWIDDSFRQTSSLENAVFVAEFLKDEKWKKRWNSEEMQMINKISENENIKNKLMETVNSTSIWIRRSQAEVLQLARDVGWVSENLYNSKITEILNLNKKPFTYEDMAFVCGMKVQANLNLADLQYVDWKNENFKYAISCLNSNNSAIWKKLDGH